MDTATFGSIRKGAQLNRQPARGNFAQDSRVGLDKLFRSLRACECRQGLDIAIRNWRSLKLDRRGRDRRGLDRRRLSARLSFMLKLVYLG